MGSERATSGTAVDAVELALQEVARQVPAPAADEPEDEMAVSGEEASTRTHPYPKIDQVEEVQAQDLETKKSATAPKY